MAERPIFVPTEEGDRLVDVVNVRFTWHAGMSAKQKKKNVAELHMMAGHKGLTPLLEISSKSDREAGIRLSAFMLPISAGGIKTTVECAFQGSKVFEQGGPYTDLYETDSRSAKKDERIRNSGRLIGFSFEGEDFPLSPATAFYDWLYVNALYPHREWLERLDQCVGFTDIEFNPERSLNCQARSCATFVALQRREALDDAMDSFGAFLTLLERSYV